MTVETVKATYDPQAKAIYVKLREGRTKIVKTDTCIGGQINYDLDKDNNIVGIEVLLS